MAVNIDVSYEVERADRIIANTVILLADSYLLGLQRKIFEYTNVLSIVKLSKSFLEYTNTVIIDDTLIVNATYIIREFLKYEFIKSTLDYFNLLNVEKCSIGNETETIIETIMDFRRYTLPITADGISAFTIPFNVNDVDKEYLTLTVGGDNVKYVTSGMGYHIVNTTLYWHGDYPLRTNYEAVLKYVVGTV